MSANIKSTLEYFEALFLIIVQPAKKISALSAAKTTFTDLFIRFIANLLYTGFLEGLTCQFALNS